MKINMRVSELDNHKLDEKSKCHYCSFHWHMRILNNYQVINTFSLRLGQKDLHLAYDSLHNKENELYQELRHFIRNSSIFFPPLLKFLVTNIYLYTFTILFH